MVPFAGWEMPVYYGGILEEHRAVRERAGLFDVSHMGEVEIHGEGALGVCQLVMSNDASKLAVGGAQYAVMCRPSGGIVDDVIVTRTREDRYLVCVNASNRDKDFAWIRDHGAGATVEDRSDAYAQLALQGPRAAGILQRLTDLDLAKLRSFTAAEGEVASVRSLVSRTGYTGEDGFEIYCAPDEAEHLWETILDTGAAEGILPIGLGARDTLRLEKGLMLYGNDIDDETTPLEAGLGWVVKLDKGDFLGREALVRQRAQGVERKLVGIVVEGGAPPRHGYRVLAGDRSVGVVTSGTKSPTLGVGIALAKVEASALGPAEKNPALAVEIRSRQHPARVVPLPFVRRTS